MEERAFEDILYMIKRSCDKNFYKGTDYDGMKQEIVRCATAGSGKMELCMWN